MDNKEYFIGIDVAKDTLEIAINKEAQPQHHLKVSNDLKGIKAFEKKAKELKVDLQNALFCLEYTGIYNYTLVDFLTRKHYAIWLENPLAIKKHWPFNEARAISSMPSALLNMLTACQ